jgi:uncharacterized membrane protein
MQTIKNFSISEALAFGWENFKSRPLFWIVISFFGLAADSGNPYSFNDENSNFAGIDPLTVFLIIGFVILLAILFSILQMGAYKAAIEAVNGVKSKWSVLISETSFIRVLMFMVISIAYALLVIFGMILLIVPGIYFALKYQYALYFYLEKNTSFSESFKLSAQATKGVKWKLFGFGLFSFLLVIAGFLLFFVGMFITIPVVYLADFYVYKKLSKQISA